MCQINSLNNYFAKGKTPLPYPVLGYSGEHNISITTNPYGFFLLFSCYLLLRACALPKIRSPVRRTTVRDKFIYNLQNVVISKLFNKICIV